MTTTIDAAAGPAMGVHRFEALQKTTPVSRASRTGQRRALEAAIWPSRPHIAGRQSFAGAVHAEWIKLRTLTSTWVTSAITIAITVLFGAGLAMGFAGSPDRADQAKTMISTGSVLGMVVVAVLGALMITGEYASGQIRSSLMAVPRRGRLFAAKALVVSGFSFGLGVLCVALAYALSYPFMKGHAGSLTDTHYLGLFWGTGLVFALIALMAQGVGYLTRSTAGAITVVVSVLFVVPIPFNLMAGHWQWVNKVLGLLPDTLSTAVSDPFSLAHQWGQTGTAAFLQHWQAVAVFTTWAIVPLAIAAVVFTRRDA
ncbi:ABC transporter permease subunit [Actinomyces oris]|uniref:ABC transporter permease subunit n=1 Tax=Actinomyces oris TaxID=544580 RepID=UPI0009D67A9D|nr:ABC transporter permease subunit [Actinomyces oris]